MSRAPEGRGVPRVISAMLNDISLPAIAALRAGSVDATKQVTPAVEPAQTAPAAPPVINPSLRLDAALGLVVIEFRNDSGEITTSIPSERQLKAYQRWVTTQFGPAPPDQHARRTSASADPGAPNEIRGHGGGQDMAVPVGIRLTADQADGEATVTSPEYAKRQA